MAACFVLDLIVTSFEAPALKDPKKVEAVVNFGGAKVSLTQSRINVTDFKSGGDVELKGSYKKTKANLEENGISIAVMYNGKPAGAGQIMIPKEVIEQIDPSMSDLMYVGNCIIAKDGEFVGQMEILSRIIVKCEELTATENAECRRNVDKCINKQDILFVMSESRACPSFCDPCLDALEPKEGDGNLKLDLQRYHDPSANSRIKDNLLPMPDETAACCELKKMACECEQLIESIAARMGHPKPLKSPCRPTAGSFEPCDPLRPPPIPVPPPASGQCFHYIPTRKNAPVDFCSPDLIPVPAGDEGKDAIKPTRFCPICLANMSWLPKLSDCPKCGNKPMPVLEERHKDPQLNSNQIIREFLGDDKYADFCVEPCEKAERDKKKAEEDESCRCTCKQGKICAHCRIQNLVSDLFQSKKEKKCPVVKPEPTEDFCIRNHDNKACRPYLERVFSELRDLYDMKSVKTGNQLDEFCERKQNVSKKICAGRSTSAIQRHSRREGGFSPKDIGKTEVRRPKAKARVFSEWHKPCAQGKPKIARNHGWGWTSSPEALKDGWRPGYVRKSVRKLMKFFLQRTAENTGFNACKEAEEIEKEKESQVPILNISKKDGEIFITLRPAYTGNIQMKPIIFKIVKSDLAVAVSQIKRLLKAQGYPKCICHNSLMMCTCRETLDKKYLEKVVDKECRRRGIENCVEHLVLTDTSDSEMEYDFDVSPPANVPSLATKPKKTNAETQFVKKDLIVPSKYPMVVGPYWRAFDCAAGDRYTGTAFGAPGEEVFEDGLFGHGGGGGHGASAAPGGRPRPQGIWGSGGGGPQRGGGRSAAAGGGGGHGGGGHGGGGGFGFGGAGGGPGGRNGPLAKLIPGNKNKEKSPPIPVRMPKRHYDNIKAAKQAEKDAHEAAIAKKKQGIDLISYLREDGAIPKLWDPNNPEPKDKPKPVVPVGPDGLTDQQRRKRALYQICVPPLDSMPRLGKGNCQCHRICGNAQCCYPCCYC